MKTVIMIMIGLALGTASGEESRLKNLTANYEKAKARAVEPIRRKYIEELGKLRAVYMQGGNLAAANAVDEALKAEKAKTPSAPASPEWYENLKGTTWQWMNGKTKFIIIIGKDGRWNGSTPWLKSSPNYEPVFLGERKVRVENTIVTFSKDYKIFHGEPTEAKYGKKTGIRLK